AHNALISHYSAPLIKNPSDANVNAMFDQALNDGLPKSEVEATRQRFLGMQNPADRQTFAYHLGVGALTALDRIHRQTGQTTLEDTGGGVAVPVTTYQPSPGNVGGSLPAPGGLARTLTPGEKTQTQQTLGAGGQPGSVPIGSRFDAQGNLKPPGWGLNNGKYPAQPPPTTPSAAGGPASSPADGGQQAAVNPPGFMPTEQPPGATAAINAGNAIYDQANAATTQKSQLLTMESDLSGISTGPLAEREARWNALAHQLGVPAGTMTADQVAKSEGFAKVAKQIALAQAGALGVGTDEKLTTTMGANPNRDLSKLGNQQSIAMLQGNADAIKARGVAYDQWLKAGNNPANANNFLTDFNKTFDPRVYQWGYQIKGMTREQKEAAYNAMPDKQQFRAKYNDAVTRGLLNP
ncbi:MAG: hypothetical protein WBG10_17535, partial [Pseudolabrys sp.]